MSAAWLPSRRDEAWRWSDLRAALAQASLPAAPTPGTHPIAALAGGAEAVTVAERTVWIERLDGPGLVAQARDVSVAPGAEAVRIVVQTGGDVALSLGRVRVGAGGRFRQMILAEGARLARIETHVEIAGAGAEVELNGVILAGPGRHADLTSHVVHAAPHGTTRQLVKSVARKGGRAVFQGKILVAAHAQKTDAQQNHHALLLDEGAEVDAKPELEIYADDVQCAHGATAGAVDEAALFYMRARGLPEPEARALLVEAFLDEAVSESLPQDVREDLFARIRAWLEAAR